MDVQNYLSEGAHKEYSEGKNGQLKCKSNTFLTEIYLSNSFYRQTNF